MSTPVSRWIHAPRLGTLANGASTSKDAARWTVGIRALYRSIAALAD